MELIKERISGRNILWLDNDPYYTEPYASALTSFGATVKVVRKIQDAFRLLGSEAFDLFILDVMIPIHDQQEEMDYFQGTSLSEMETGLVIYKKLKARLTEEAVHVLVLTVRIDLKIRDSFISEGLPPTHFCTRMQLRHTDLFIEKVAEVLATVP